MNGFPSLAFRIETSRVVPTANILLSGEYVTALTVEVELISNIVGTLSSKES